MSELSMKKRWLEYVCLGVGKERSFTDERFGYKGAVLYSYSWPVARVIKTSDDRWVLLTRGTSIHRAARGVGIKYDAVIVNDIGALSQFQLDVLDPETTHERLRHLYEMEAGELVDLADGMSPQWLFGKGGQASHLTGSMKRVYEQYELYSNTFGIKWRPMPSHYQQRLASILNERRGAYFNKDAVASRVRKKARREAKKALLGDD